MRELFQEVEAAVLGRNPGLAAGLQPGLSGDQIRSALKRAGIKRDVESLVQLYGWHDGTVLASESEGYRLGIAPPVISETPKETVEWLRGLGYDVSGPKTVYNSFWFFPFEAAIRWTRHWKKFAATVRACARLAHRFVPFISTTNSGEFIALEITSDGKGRVVMIGGNDKQVRAAYPSFEEFLRDLIRANQNNELLSCVHTPGELLEFEATLMVKKPKRHNADTIQTTGKAFVLRTDYSDEAAWERLKSKLASSGDELSPDLDFISNPAFADLPAENVRGLLPDNSDHSYCFIADRTALVEKDSPILAVDLSKKKPKTFRVAASALGDVENNLSIGNMSFDEFAKAVAADGVYRGDEDQK